MEKKNNIVRNIGVVSLVLIAMILIVFLVGKTFGFFNYAKKGEVVNVITINGLAVNIINNSDEALNIANAYPMYDSEGMTQEPFEFTITNTSSKPIDYTLRVLNDEEKQDLSKLFSTEYIRFSYKIGNGTWSEAKTLGGTNDNIIFSETINRNETRTIAIKLWVSSDAPNSIQGKEFYGKLILTGEKALTATLYSAALDEVYYYDVNNQKVVLGTTDESGKLENATIPYNVNIYSSVAKDPNNLLNPYTKSFGQHADIVYLMPDGYIMYWYGYEPKTLNIYEIKGMGDSFIGGNTSITRYTNYYYQETSIAGNQGMVSNGELIDFSRYNTLNSIAKTNPTSSARAFVGLVDGLVNNCNYYDPYIQYTTESEWTYKSTDISNMTDSGYLMTKTNNYNGNSRYIYVEAIYLD